MRQVVDFRRDESIINFIKAYTSQLYDQLGATTFNPNIRKCSFQGYIVISNLLKNQEIVINFKIDKFKSSISTNPPNDFII